MTAFLSTAEHPLLMVLVYSLGGSILAERDSQSLKEYADALKQLSQNTKSS